MRLQLRDQVLDRRCAGHAENTGRTGQPFRIAVGITRAVPEPELEVRARIVDELDVRELSRVGAVPACGHELDRRLRGGGQVVEFEGLDGSACAARHGRLVRKVEVLDRQGLQRHLDIVRRIDADLHLLRFRALGDQLDVAIPCGLVGHPPHLLHQLVELRGDVAAVFVSVGAVRGLDRELAHAQEHILQLFHRAFGRLSERDAVIGVPDRHVEAFDLVAHPVGDRKT